MVLNSDSGRSDADSPQTVSAIIGLGSNLGDRRRNIERGLELLGSTEGIEIAAASRLIETDPEGGPPQGRYLNGVAEVHTSLDPFTLLDVLHEVERECGRVRTVQYGPRELDMDILLYGDWILDAPLLQIPHPRMTDRAFVLDVLVEIAPERLVPLTRRTVIGHWQVLHDEAAAHR